MERDYTGVNNSDYSENLNENMSDGTSGVDESSFVFKNVINARQNSRLFSLISVVFSGLSILLSVFPWIALILGCLGIVFAVISRKNIGYFDNLSLAGLIIGIFGTVFAAMGLIFVYFIENSEFYEKFIKVLGLESGSGADGIPEEIYGNSDFV